VYGLIGTDPVMTRTMSGTGYSPKTLCSTRC
jgi:hypothetical protein